MMTPEQSEGLLQHLLEDALDGLNGGGFNMYRHELYGMSLEERNNVSRRAHALGSGLKRKIAELASKSTKAGQQSDAELFHSLGLGSDGW